MIAIVIAVALAATALFGKGSRKRTVLWGLGYGVALTTTGCLAVSGTLAETRSFPPPMAILIASVLVTSLALGLSPLGKSLAHSADTVGLVALQAFRLPLELLMHHAASKNIMPKWLSYSGYNFDIVTGAAAIVVAAALAQNKAPRALLWAWNAWGIVCLLVITLIAVATSPMVHAFGTDPKDVNTWVLYAPYVWLPAILVSTAILSHVVLTRKLLESKAPTCILHASKV